MGKYKKYKQEWSWDKERAFSLRFSSEHLEQDITWCNEQSKLMIAGLPPFFIYLSIGLQVILIMHLQFCGVFRR